MLVYQSISRVGHHPKLTDIDEIFLYKNGPVELDVRTLTADTRLLEDLGLFTVRESNIAFVKDKSVQSCIKFAYKL